MSNSNFAYMKRIVAALTNNYQGFPLDSESEIPEKALADWITNPPDNNGQTRERSPESLLHTFIHTVSNLDCFTYRAVNTADNGEAEYWNALSQSFLEFKEAGTVIYQTDTQFPTPDMIKFWCNKQRP